MEKYIPAMTAGESVGAIAMTEPDAGSDLQVRAGHMTRNTGRHWWFLGLRYVDFKL